MLILFVFVGAYKRFTGLKNLNSGLTTMLAIGGWNEKSEKYSKVSQSYFFHFCLIQGNYY